MTGDAELAMAFCREVLGWDRPVDRRYGEREKDPFGIPSKAWTPYIFEYDQKHPQLHYTELNHVMPLAARWCDARDAILETAYQSKKYAVRVRLPSDLPGGNLPLWTESGDPCQAIMAACLSASRRLKAAA